MERYNRVYRDPKSPLTPLTPLSSINAFNFDFGGDNSLQHCIEKIEFTPPLENTNKPRCPRRFSENFLKIRNVFEKPLTKAKLTTTHVKKNINTNVLRTPNSAKRKPMGDLTNDIYLAVPHYVGSVPSIKTTSALSPSSSLQMLRATKTKRKQLQQQLHLQQVYAKQFRKASPIALRSLSPRLSALLNKAGLSRYRAHFQREEIDIEVFRMLTEPDLVSLGITQLKDQQQILKSKSLAYDF